MQMYRRTHRERGSFMSNVRPSPRPKLICGTLAGVGLRPILCVLDRVPVALSVQAVGFGGVGHGALDPSGTPIIHVAGIGAAQSEERR